MDHPFEVGGTYRNRHDDYEVVELKGQSMVIRYPNGRRLATSVELQARIWGNIQAEERMRPPTDKPAAAPRPRRRGRQRGLAFQGLQDHDFQNGVGGTSWRARTGLGGLLAEHLSDTTGRFFQSYAIYRRAEVHLARPTHYDSRIKWQQVKFVFELDPGGTTYGFYIEKNDGPMDDTWDWPRFLTALEGKPRLRHQVEQSARQLGLRWEVYLWDDDGLIATVPTSTTGWIWHAEQRDVSEEIDWPTLNQRLRAIETEKWCDLYLCTSMSKQEAIAAGTELVDPVTEVYQALLPLYEASIPRISPGPRDD